MKNQLYIKYTSWVAFSGSEGSVMFFLGSLHLRLLMNRIFPENVDNVGAVLATLFALKSTTKLILIHVHIPDMTGECEGRKLCAKYFLCSWLSRIVLIRHGSRHKWFLVPIKVVFFGSTQAGYVAMGIDLLRDSHAKYRSPPHLLGRISLSLYILYLYLWTSTNQRIF